MVSKNDSNTRQLLHRGIDLILTGIDLANEEPCPALREGILLMVRAHLRVLNKQLDACVSRCREHLSEED